jgi:hypothetical protein
MFGITIGLESAIFGLILAAIFWFFGRDYQNHLLNSDFLNCRKDFTENYSELFNEAPFFSSFSFADMYELTLLDEFKKLNHEEVEELVADMKQLNFLIEENKINTKKAKWYENAALVCIGFSLFSFLTFFLYGV